MAGPRRAASAVRPGAAGRLQRALAAHRAGRFAEAETLYANLLAREPAHAEAAYLLAAVLLDQGRPGPALPHIDTCLGLRPADPRALRLRGLVLARLSRGEDALLAFAVALEAQPGMAEIHNDRGMLLQNLGRIAEALEAYHRAIALNPAYAEAHNNCGNALVSLGRAAEALGAYEAALACDPGRAETRNNHGNALKALGRSGEALVSYDAALRLRPDYPAAHSNRGNALRDLGRRAEALSAYEAALHLQPDHTEAQGNRAMLLAELGRFEAALAACESALVTARDPAGLHATHGMILERLGRSDAALRAYEAAGPRDADAQAARGLLLVSLGRVPDGCAALETALALEPGTTRFFYNLTQCCRIAVDDPRIAPMEARLAATPPLPTRDRLDVHFGLGKVYADAGQAEVAFRHLAAGNRLQRAQTRYDEPATLGRLRRLIEDWRPEQLPPVEVPVDNGPVPVFILGMPRSGSTLVEQLLAGHPDVFAAGEVDDLGTALRTLGEAGHALLLGGGTPPADLRAALSEAGQAYRDRLRTLAPEARVVTNKTPDNFRLVGLIRLMLPEARILHTRRHPLDTCLSCYATRFTGHQPYAYDLGELGRFYAAYAAAMAHWRRLLPEGEMLDVDYERVVGDLEAETRRLVGHCGLVWDSACLDFQHVPRPVLTASMGQVREPLHRRAVGKWQAYAAHLDPLVAALGPAVSLTQD